MHRALYETVMDHDKVAVKLHDDRNGEPFFWWRSIVDAESIVIEPRRCFLESQTDAIRALTLLCDIVAIGDSVFKLFEKQWEHQFETDTDFGYTLVARPGSECNAIFEEVGLTSWGKLSGWMAFPDSRAQRYGLLFFMLSGKSHMYSRSPRRVFGVDVVNEVWKSGDASDVTRDWLKGWGFNPGKPIRTAARQRKTNRAGSSTWTEREVRGGRVRGNPYREPRWQGIAEGP